jgi:hypothetical protein
MNNQVTKLPERVANCTPFPFKDLISDLSFPFSCIRITEVRKGITRVRIIVCLFVCLFNN